MNTKLFNWIADNRNCFGAIERNFMTGYSYSTLRALIKKGEMSKKQEAKISENLLNWKETRSEEIEELFHKN